MTNKKKNINLEIEAKQIEKSQNIMVKWATDIKPDSVSIVVKHNRKEFINTTLSSYQTALGFYSIQAFYGKQEVVVKIKKDNEVVSKSVKVNLWTDKYIIAPLTATMPVTLFSLSLNEITRNYTVPTFIWLERVGAWNYLEMKENLHLIPVLDKEDLVHDKSVDTIYEKISAWVKELYEINPQSVFHFYCNDCACHGWMEATYGNNLPLKNYQVTLLCDGPTSYFFFNDRFTQNDSYEETYSKMKQEYDAIKLGLKNNSNFIRTKKKLLATGLRDYTYVMVQEESNLDWWLTRISETMLNNKTVYTKLKYLAKKNKIYIKDINLMLKDLTIEEKAYLRNLYNFNGDLFKQAKEQNKEPMVILGTWTQFEDYFEEYITILKKVCGDKYVFYYKGHPKNPTELVEGKEEILRNLGLIDIDATVPAQLMFFFNPEACASGYPTSTLYSTNAKKSVAVFNVRKNKSVEDYKSKIQYFITKINKNDVYSSLVKGRNAFVVEFENNSKYDIAIYQNNELKYFKKKRNEFFEVIK